MRSAARSDREGDRPTRARSDRPGCVVQARHHGGPTAQDALGKILRGTMKIADGQVWTMPATIDDPAILDEIGEALDKKGA
jgi:hypothetical protein